MLARVCAAVIDTTFTGYGRVADHPEPDQFESGRVLDQPFFWLYIYEKELHEYEIVLSHCLFPDSLVACTRPVDAVDGSTNGRVCQREASPEGVFLETSWPRPFSRRLV